MNKKMMNGILVVTLLLVWGWVMYTLFAPEESAELEFQTTNQPTRKTDSGLTKKRYALNLDYPDPFLKGLKVKGPATKASTPEPLTTRPTKDIVPPPKMIYKGMLKSTPREAARLIITLNGKDRVIDPNNHDLSFKVLRYNADSIWISHEHTRFAFGHR